MAQSAQSTPTATTNIGGTNQQVNLRDYLNIRVAPFLKKAITESLDAAPEFPLQWLGEHLIHQSMLYEGNPDRTNIRERFVYKFEDPVAPPAGVTSTVVEPGQSQSTTIVADAPSETTSTINGAPQDSVAMDDIDMSNHANGVEMPQDQSSNDSKDTEMRETAQD